MTTKGHFTKPAQPAHHLSKLKSKPRRLPFARLRVKSLRYLSRTLAVSLGHKKNCGDFAVAAVFKSVDFLLRENRIG
jgi:hypothetical protein